MPSDYLPTLYKNRHANRKQHVCAICLDRTRGTTQNVDYGYGVSIYLCPGHASPDFQRQRGGRDLVLHPQPGMAGQRLPDHQPQPRA